MSDPNSSLPKQVREPVWLEPFPDDLLADQRSDPQDRAESREQTSLAFLIALQYLTPAQRAILLLREVLDWEASEVAEWLNMSVPAVNSALQRARRVMKQHNFTNQAELAPPSQRIQALLDRYVALWEQADIPGFVALLREDAWFTMPPLPVWVQGRTDIATLFSIIVFKPGRHWLLLPTRANGSPAFALYRRETHDDTHQLYCLMVLDVVDGQIADMVAFLDLPSLAPFALPPMLDE